MIFISHAWEDSEFTSWLALQLAKEGYGVWCDLTKLLGGENWPKEINDALQKRTQKFLFVLSRMSNKKENPLGELQLAINVKKSLNPTNFIVPLKIEDIHFNEIDFRIQNIQAIPFEKNWAHGFAQLLEMLDRDKIKKNQAFNPTAVNIWWRKHGTDASKVFDTSEVLYSNIFPIVSFPEKIYAHFTNEDPLIKGHIKYPIVPFKQYILSFSNADELKKEQGVISRIKKSYELKVTDVLNGNDRLIDNTQTGNYYFTRLLNQSFDKGVRLKKLEPFRLSKGYCFYFHEDILRDGRIIYKDNGKLNSRIKLWGKFKEENWYWAIRARVEKEPLLQYIIQPHVLVKSKRGIHAAPKGAHKSWRNDTWRDRLKASIAHLSEDKAEVELSVGENQAVIFSKEPVGYHSPVSYEEPKEQIEKDEIDIEE